MVQLITRVGTFFRRQLLGTECSTTDDFSIILYIRSSLCIPIDSIVVRRSDQSIPIWYCDKCLAIL